MYNCENPATQCPLTDSLVARMQQLGEGGGGILPLDGGSTLGVLSKLTEHARCHPGDVLSMGVQQLGGGGGRGEGRRGGEGGGGGGEGRGGEKDVSAEVTAPPQEVMLNL